VPSILIARWPSTRGGIRRPAHLRTTGGADRACLPCRSAARTRARKTPEKTPEKRRCVRKLTMLRAND
jgi:hypothetical protein